MISERSFKRGLGDQVEGPPKKKRLVENESGFAKQSLNLVSPSDSNQYCLLTSKTHMIRASAKIYSEY